MKTKSEVWAQYIGVQSTLLTRGKRLILLESPGEYHMVVGNTTKFEEKDHALRPYLEKDSIEVDGNLHVVFKYA